MKKGLLLCLTIIIFSACSSTKYLRDDQTILTKVELASKDKNIHLAKYRAYVQQEPNSRWFNILKVPLGLYCISGKDSTKWVNKFFRRIGEPPVIYDATATQNTCQSLTKTLQNEGYLHSKVLPNITFKNHRVQVVYSLVPGNRFYINSIQRRVKNSSINAIIMKDTLQSVLRVGTPCDINLLEIERKRLVQLLQRNGYYKIHNELISYELDTIKGNRGIDVKLVFGKLYDESYDDSVKLYNKYHINRVVISCSEDDKVNSNDSLIYKGCTFKYSNKLPIRLKTLYDNIAFRPGDEYNERNIQNTYSNLDGLQAVQYAIVKLSDIDSNLINCNVFVKTNKKHSVSTELEGTNTAGNLGAAATLAYTNKNIFGGSETFSMKIKGAYEAITGLENYRDENYVELSAEANLQFPRFIMPFLTDGFRKNVKALSEISFLYGTQDRPEFHRRILTEAWTYRWNKHGNRMQHKLDLMSLNYVFMPWISDTFKKEYLDSANSKYSILRNSYENQFIMNMSYGLVYNSMELNSSGNTYQTNAFQIRLNIETAGNFLYAASKLFNSHSDEYGQFRLFNIAYAQYAKFDFDFAKSFLLNERNSIAFHTAFGIAIPYGNSSVVPYEKRYFAGGANSVRGWGVRELGPGSYEGKDGNIDFINQTGNIKLNVSVEYRTYLFWKLHGALFIDAGNIWNTRSYQGQEGGQFFFDKFYKQIAASYGLGLRLNLDYFILRFDMAMKAVSPTYKNKKEHYPIASPRFNRDFAFHFAVGLPF
ncbi:MAG: BamA/TamA family outer membrane protein [Bacteroidaceae bacterium]